MTTTRQARCWAHGGLLTDDMRCQTTRVLEEVAGERARQFARYGTNEDLPDGTGPDVEWIPEIRLAAKAPAAGIEQGLRSDYEWADATGSLTFMHLVREEVAEAFAENDPGRLREELIQVAALAVSWIEKLDARDT